MMIGPLRNNLWRRNSDKPFMWLDSRQESSTRAATQGRSSFGIILIRNPWRVDHDEKDSNQRQVFHGSTQPTEGGSHVRRKGSLAHVGGLSPRPQAAFWASASVEACGPAVELLYLLGEAP